MGQCGHYYNLWKVQLPDYYEKKEEVISENHFTQEQIEAASTLEVDI